MEINTDLPVETPDMVKKEDLEKLIESFDLSGATIEDIEDLMEKLEDAEISFYKRLDKFKKSLVQTVVQKKKKLARGVERSLPKVDHHVNGLPKVFVTGQTNPIGDVNLLMSGVPLTVAPFDKIMIGLARDLIQKTGGLEPSMQVQSARESDEEAQRIVVKWHIAGRLTTEQVFGIHHLTEQAYGRKLRGHKTDGSGWDSVVRKYIGLDNKKSSSHAGFYFGPQTVFTSMSVGTVISRKFSSISEARFLIERYPEDWFARTTEPGKETKTEIEIRDGAFNREIQGLTQENFLCLVVQISYLLAKKKFIDDRILFTAIFRELNKIGAAEQDRNKLFGMRPVLETIERVLLMPLQQPSLAEYYKIIEPESALLVGVPGVGKSFLAHYLMTGSYNAIFASVDTDKLFRDLKKSGEEGASPMLLRIDKIRSLSSLPVVLLLDDVEILFEEKGEMVIKILNLMQGVRARGFHLLASTNHPERIDPRLLEPGRISRVIYVSLPSFEDRMGVLHKHLQNIPFKDENDRSGIIERLAAKHKNWTQRYLWFLCVETAKLCGYELIQGNIFAEGQISGRPLEEKDFEKATQELSKAINLKDVLEWDKRIQRFVSQANVSIGFK